LNSLLNHVAAALTARQASETRVRQFVADASHELRTPLAAIRGYAELTRRSGAAAPPEVAYALGRVESEAARMSTLVDDLLLLARLDAGRPLARDEVDLVPLVVHAVSDAHVAGPQHRWQLDLPDEEVRIAGDEARLHQVVTNLLANARVHTPAGTTVTVRVRQEKDLVRLCVSDTGPGIPPKLLPSVFQRFARADESRSRTAGSTGLGLAIVSAVVHAHGGEVDVASEPGRTTFTVTLPALAAVHSSPTASTGGRHSGAVESRDDSDSSRQEGPESYPVTPDSTEKSVFGAYVR
jgi:two-component system OmpR family sensor kinase